MEKRRMRGRNTRKEPKDRMYLHLRKNTVSLYLPARPSASVQRNSTGRQRKPDLQI